MQIEIAGALEELRQARIRFEEALAALIAEDEGPDQAAGRGADAGGALTMTEGGHFD